MTHIRTDLQRDGIPVVRMESDHLQVDVAPQVGGRIVSLRDQASDREFLWRNDKVPLAQLPPGAEYDPNFFGGIDELLPNDVPESLQSVPCPDHGELWTTALSWRVEANRLKLQGRLPLFGLNYEREMILHAERPCLESRYTLTNLTSQPREFLWKLHAALAVQPGDIIECPAAQARVVDLAWSRFQSLEPFPWPAIEGCDARIVPAPNGTMDFFYLFDLAAGRMALRSCKSDLLFGYRFDRRTFPYAWLFASYGGFNGQYTVVLEPCTTMPISVIEAAAQKQCARLEPGGILKTRVQLWAGPAPQVEAGLSEPFETDLA